MATYHFGWCDEHGRPTERASGKALRPTMTLLSARAAGGSAAAAIHSAVAIELVHNFSLVHDDVMDEDRFRHHRATVWSVFGVSEAILTGDALLALAMRAMVGNEGPTGRAAARCLADALVDLCAGQAVDVEFESRHQVEPADCLRMETGKTASLIGCACRLGALAADASEDVVARFGEFGDGLGMAFQLVDDMLGIWGDPEVTGKPAGADLARRKKSMPVVAALAAGTPEARELASLYGGTAPLDDAGVRRAADLVERAGGRERTQHKITELVDAATRSLEAVHGEPAAVAQLFDMAHFLTTRTS